MIKPRRVKRQHQEPANVGVLRKAPHVDAERPDTFVGALALGMRAPTSSTELNFDEDTGSRKAGSPKPFHRTAAMLRDLLEPSPLPDWMLDPSLLPKHPPTRAIAS